jgi:hypothetical protein
MATEKEDENFVLTQVVVRTPQETLEERWFAERRPARVSLPPPRRPSVPPIDDDELDPWLR